MVLNQSPGVATRIRFLNNTIWPVHKVVPIRIVLENTRSIPLAIMSLISHYYDLPDIALRGLESLFLVRRRFCTNSGVILSRYRNTEF